MMEGDYPSRCLFSLTFNVHPGSRLINIEIQSESCQVLQPTCFWKYMNNEKSTNQFALQGGFSKSSSHCIGRFLIGKSPC